VFNVKPADIGGGAEQLLRHDVKASPQSANRGPIPIVSMSSKPESSRRTSVTKPPHVPAANEQERVHVANDDCAATLTELKTRNARKIPIEPRIFLIIVVLLSIYTTLRKRDACGAVGEPINYSSNSDSIDNLTYQVKQFKVS
jgi:hypothetical protein